MLELHEALTQSIIDISILTCLTTVPNQRDLRQTTQNSHEIN